jgi:hypothetical protein
MLEDGTYEAMVVDAGPARGEAEGVLRIEVTITTGPHKGEVVALRGRAAGRDELDLLAAPATLTVVEGRPHLTFDRT